MNFFNKLFRGRAAGNVQNPAQKIIVPEKPKLYRIITDSYYDRDPGIFIGIGNANLPPEVGYISQHRNRLTLIGTLGQNFCVEKAKPGDLEAVLVSSPIIDNIWNIIVEDGRIYSIVSEPFADVSKKRLPVVIDKIKERCGFYGYINGCSTDLGTFKLEIRKFSYDQLEIKAPEELITTS